MASDGRNEVILRNRPAAFAGLNVEAAEFFPELMRVVPNWGSA